MLVPPSAKPPSTISSWCRGTLVLMPSIRPIVGIRSPRLLTMLAHEHLHIVANIVNNRGERIPTMGLIEKAHEAAAAITRERGYQWGETAKKEAVEKAHKPHEKVRMLVKPIVKEAVAEARSLEELKTVLASKGISCVFTVASDGRRGGISFAYEYEGQLHTFRGSSLDRQLSFGYIKAAIDKNSAREDFEFAVKCN